jgi:hypothetical protein
MTTLDEINQLSLTKNDINNFTNKNKNKQTKLYFFSDNFNNETFVTTTQVINKYIWNFLNRAKKKNEILKTILNNNNYKYELISDIEYDNIQDLNCKINNIKFEYNKKKSIKKDKLIGDKREKEVLPIIKKYFKNDNIKKMKFDKCKFDFIGFFSGYLYELKSNNYDIYKYKTAVIGLDKILPYPKQIFLFTFENIYTDKGFDLYYYIKDSEISTFNIRDLPRYDRNTISKVIDIPFDKLSKINDNESFDLDIEHNVNKFINVVNIYGKGY